MTLADYITANLRKPFVWGEFDCVLFGANWVKHATGIDHLPDAPKWSSAKEAMRTVKRLGGLEKLIDDRLERIHPNLANDGDIGLYRGCIGLFSGPHLVGPGKQGLERIDRTQVSGAWRVVRVEGRA